MFRSVRIISWIVLGFAVTGGPPILANPPSIIGTVFHDADLSGGFTSGEGVSNVMMSLYIDDGDNMFDAASDTFLSSQSTSLTGNYQFESLSFTESYFVYQPAQVVGGVSLPAAVSELKMPGEFKLLIDDFSSQQELQVNPIYPTAASAVTDSNILGNQRDMMMKFIAGPAEARLRSNPYGLKPVLQIDQSAGVIAKSVITWDGIDGDLSEVPSLGLGGLDLTNAGLNTAFALSFGTDKAGADEEFTLRVYSSNGESSATLDFPLTGGLAMDLQVVPFNDFMGDVDFTDVRAIQLILGGNKTSVDSQVGDIGIIGPVSADFSVVPEPSSLALIGMAMLGLGLQRRSRRSTR